MRRAFTLIELLVVIAILAVRAAILFPVFAKARERARQTQCASNLKQLHTAIQTYLQDWDDKYPYAWYDYYVRTQGKSPALSVLMEPYVRNAEVWKCPSDIGETLPDGPSGWKKHTPPFYTDVTHSSYEYMRAGIGRTYGLLAGISMHRIPRPVTTILLMEPRPWHGNYRHDEEMMDSPALYNVLYCDGHVQQRTYKVLWNQIETVYR